MTNAPLTPEERLARLEGVYEHLATKADVAGLQADIAGLQADIMRVEGKIDTVRASFRTLLIAMTSGLALLNILTAIVLRFWPS